MTTNNPIYTQVLLAIRPWESDQDMSLLRDNVIGIKYDGLLWGASTTEEIGYGISDLLIALTLDENKVKLDNILSELMSMEDIISRVDVRLWNRF
jgi:translation elongation factor EF-1beta